jgi:hypothetical protein
MVGVKVRRGSEEIEWIPSPPSAEQAKTRLWHIAC